MVNILQKFLSPLRTKSQSRFWFRAAARADSMPTSELVKLRRHSKKVQSSLTKFDEIAFEQLSAPSQNTDAMRRPKGADWSCRPKIWSAPMTPNGLIATKNKTKINKDTAVYHDSKSADVSIRQVRNRKRVHLAPFGLSLDIFEFDGSYLSLSVQIPQSELPKTVKENIISLSLMLESEYQCEMFVRLNLQNGPNKQEIPQELNMGQLELTAEFDLFTTDFNVLNTSKMWIDVIFKTPRMNKITVRDLCIHRRPRAKI